MRHSRYPSCAIMSRRSSTTLCGRYASTPSGLSERLKPRRSGATAKKRAPKASSWASQANQASGNPCRKSTSGRPGDPALAKCRRMPFGRFAYWPQRIGLLMVRAQASDELDDLFAEILAAQQPNERLGCAREILCDGLAKL